jgi:hypothetical protein
LARSFSPLRNGSGKNSFRISDLIRKMSNLKPIRCDRSRHSVLTDGLIRASFGVSCRVSGFSAVPIVGRFRLLHALWFRSRQTFKCGPLQDWSILQKVVSLTRLLSGDLDPFRETAMAGLVRWILRGKIVPGRPGAEHPQNAIEYVTGTARRSPASFACSMFLGDKRLQKSPLRFSDVHTLRLGCTNRKNEPK